MTTKDYVLVGARRGASGAAFFADAPPVVESPDGHLFAVSGGEHEPLDTSSWRHLVSTGEAIALKRALRYEPGMSVWVVRRRLTDAVVKAWNEEAERDGALISRESVAHKATVFVVRPEHSTRLRDSLAAQQYSFAWQKAQESDWSAAHEAASRMWLLERAPGSLAAAFYALTFERLGKKIEADGILESEANSSGASLVELQRLMAEISRRLQHDPLVMIVRKGGALRTKMAKRKQLVKSKQLVKVDALKAPKTILFKDRDEPAACFDAFGTP